MWRKHMTPESAQYILGVGGRNMKWNGLCIVSVRTASMWWVKLCCVTEKRGVLININCRRSLGKMYSHPPLVLLFVITNHLGQLLHVLLSSFHLRISHFSFVSLRSPNGVFTVSLWGSIFWIRWWCCVGTVMGSFLFTDSTENGIEPCSPI